MAAALLDSPAASSAASALPLWAGVGIAYLLGAVPFGWLLVRGLRGIDLRTVGSGNIGATNAMRVLGRPLGLLAFLLDFGKGWAPAELLAGGDPRHQLLLGLAAVCGHVWPVYLGFRGGKAVATSSGVIVAIDPLVFLAGGLAWLVTLFTSRYVSLASLVMGAVFPLVAAWRASRGAYGWEFPIALGALAVLIVIRHRENISRLLAGTESRAALGRRSHKEASG